MKSIAVNGKKINYIHKPSNRKTVSAFINKDGLLEVRTPLYAGDEYVSEFILANAVKILQLIDRSRIRAEYENSLDDARICFLRKAAEEVIPERVRHYSSIIGVKPASVKINGAKTRFGSCSSRGNLNFSYRLMAYSAKAVDYVVIHELCHMLHMNHSGEFWNTVAVYMPDYNTAREELKKTPAFPDKHNL